MKANGTSWVATRIELSAWQQDLKNLCLIPDGNLQHTFNYHFKEDLSFLNHLTNFANVVTQKIEPLVQENHQLDNLPKIQHYDQFGNDINRVIHHPTYIAAGDLIYGSGLCSFLHKPGQLKKALALFLLSSHAGEAGHNCPIACSAGVIRILNRYADNIPEKDSFIQKLLVKSFQNNYTGAQFLTEIQGGSDVGANACIATAKNDRHWLINGEKWFCSNANADLILMTARFDTTISGTGGLGLFLVPRQLENGELNRYYMQRLKEKTGTRTLATAEMIFQNTLAYPIGEMKPNNGIRIVLENVLHISRIFNAFSVLGMTRRAYQTAFHYSRHRKAFGKTIIEYPLVQEQLVKIKSIFTAQISASFFIADMQDEIDFKQAPTRQEKLLLRILVNLNKFFTAKYSVENIRHCLDILAGNGTILTFSSIPRLLNDAIVCENWEGTHFTLWMQILRDIERDQVDEIFLQFLDEALMKLPHNEPFVTELINRKKYLSEQFKHLKLMEQDSKTLAMNTIATECSVIFSALALLKESLNDPQRSVKQTCLKAFLLNFPKNNNLSPMTLKNFKEILHI